MNLSELEQCRRHLICKQGRSSVHLDGVTRGIKTEEYLINGVCRRVRMERFLEDNRKLGPSNGSPNNRTTDLVEPPSRITESARRRMCGFT